MVGAFIDLAQGGARWKTAYKLGLQDIELRYKRSMLGPFWLSASLVATVLALSYLFSQIFGMHFVDYVSFVGAGMLGWTLIAAMVNEGCGSVQEHAAYLSNVRMPLSMLAWRITLRNAIVFAHNLIAIIGILLAFGVILTPVAAMVVPGVLVNLVFGFFCVLAIGPVCARFRDIPQVVSSIIQVTFFMTPIFWMPDQAAHRPMFTDGNPFYHLIELVRAPLLGTMPSTMNWIVSGVACGVVALLAIVSVSMTRKRINLWL